MKKALKIVRLIIEVLWRILVGLINLPIAIIELIWLRIFYEDRFVARINEINNAWNGQKENRLG